MADRPNHGRPVVLVRRGLVHGIVQSQEDSFLASVGSPAKAAIPSQRCGGGRRILRKKPAS